MYVLSGVDEALLSKTTLKKLDFLPHDWPRKPVQQVIENTGKVQRVNNKKGTYTREMLLEDYKEVFKNTVEKPMKADPVKIHLMEGSVPYKTTVAKPIPFAYRDQIKSQLDEMEADGVIEKVSGPSGLVSSDCCG